MAHFIILPPSSGGARGGRQANVDQQRLAGVSPYQTGDRSDRRGSEKALVSRSRRVAVDVIGLSHQLGTVCIDGFQYAVDDTGVRCVQEC